MTKRLDEKIGEHDYNGLIVSTSPAPRMTQIEFTPGASADVPAGTILVKTGVAVTPPAQSSGTPTATAAAEAYAVISKELTGNDLVVVLAEDVPKGTAKVVVNAYKAGNFAREKLLSGTYTMTSDDYGYLAQAGIASAQTID